MSNEVKLIQDILDESEQYGLQNDRGLSITRLAENLKKSLETKNRIEFRGQTYIYAHKYDHIEVNRDGDLYIAEAMHNGVYAIHGVIKDEQEISERAIYNASLDDFILSQVSNTKSLSDKEVFDLAFLLSAERVLQSEHKSRDLHYSLSLTGIPRTENLKATTLANHLGHNEHSKSTLFETNIGGEMYSLLLIGEAIDENARFVWVDESNKVVEDTLSQEISLYPEDEVHMIKTTLEQQESLTAKAM
jgi:hypothetical protein